MRATVDSDALSRMRWMLARDAAPRDLMTREHFANVFGFPLEGEHHAALAGSRRVLAWITGRSPLAALTAALSDSLRRLRPLHGGKAERLCAELSRPAMQENFMDALRKRLPAGGPPLQHLEDALTLALQRAPYRSPLSEGATPALQVAESIYDLMFCATYAYYHEIIGSPATAMAYAQGYAETVSGVALGRRQDGAETYRPILGGGGYYETLEALLTRMQRLDAVGGPLKVHFAPLRLLGGAPDEATSRENG